MSLGFGPWRGCVCVCVVQCYATTSCMREFMTQKCLKNSREFKHTHASFEGIEQKTMIVE